MSDVVLGGPDFPFEVQGFNQFDIQVPITDATVAFDAPTVASDKVDGDGKNGSLHALAVGSGNITARAAGVDAAPFPINVVQDTVVKTVRIVPGAGGGGPTP